MKKRKEQLKDYGAFCFVLMLWGSRVLGFYIDWVSSHYVFNLEIVFVLDVWFATIIFAVIILFCLIFLCFLSDRILVHDL